jgi:hypothetical protein
MMQLYRIAKDVLIEFQDS